MRKKDDRRDDGADERKGQASKKKEESASGDQRDPRDSSPHMPRHWQGTGARGEAPGQKPPGPDERELARGNQYGRAGEIASGQVHASTTEHGEVAPPQRRDNEQLPKRPGERATDLPTPKEPGGRK